jgi:DNA polymerase delta subunit 1
VYTLSRAIHEGKLSNLFPDNKVFEADIPFLIRFMVDVKLKGFSWVTLPEGSYQLRKSHIHKESTCQLEADVLYSSIVAHDAISEPAWGHSAPFRILRYLLSLF